MRRGDAAGTIDREIGLAAPARSTARRRARNSPATIGVRKVSNSFPLNSFDARARSISPFVAVDQPASDADLTFEGRADDEIGIDVARIGGKDIHRLGFSAIGHPHIMHPCSLESGALRWHLMPHKTATALLCAAALLMAAAGPTVCSVGREKGTEAPFPFAESNAGNGNGAGAHLRHRGIQGRRR